jgi:hypothetical protein
MDSSEQHEKMSVETVLNKITEILDQSREHAIKTLKQFVDRDPKEGEIFATVEIMTTEGYTFTYNPFFIKEEDGQKKLNAHWGEFFSDGVSLIPKLEEYTEDVLSKHADEYTQTEGEEFTDKHIIQLSHWFKECWYAAGGEHSKLPTYLSFDKEYMCRDIITGELMEDTEVARKLGHETVSV